MKTIPNINTIKTFPAGEICDQGARMNILPIALVVDDYDDLRHMFSYDLEMLGFSVIEACDATQAKEILKVVPEINLVLTDFSMPGGGGLEILSWVAAQSGVKPVVIVASAYVDETSRNRIEALIPGTIILNKPFSFEVLRLAIASNLWWD